MNKTELVTRVAEETGLPKVVVMNVFERSLETIANEVISGGKVSINGFGSFEKLKRKGKKGINPQTKEPMEIPESVTVKFKPAKTFKGYCNS